MNKETATVPSGPTEARAGKVLVVEDERPLRLLYGQTLESAGFEVVLAASAREALDAIEAGATDDLSVIVSDISMPGMDGMELLRIVRGRGCETPVILVTGNPTIESAAAAVEFGAMRYLVKPVARNDLIDLVNRAAKLHRIAVLKREAALHLGAAGVQAGDRAWLEATLSRALAGLWIAYQPIVNPVRKEVFAFEALVRTQEPSIPHPGVLFSIAERLDRVREVGCSIRANIALTLAEKLLEQDIFLNLHAHDLLEESLYSPASPLSPFAPQIVLEITERATLEHVDDVPDRIRMLRRLGYRVAIDDLGAGYSGLNYFAMLSPDIVKLDMVLIRNIHQDDVKRKIVYRLCSLCKELGMLVIAEGIEIAEEAAAARELGCDLLQGNLFARPGPPFPEVLWTPTEPL